MKICFFLVNILFSPLIIYSQKVEIVKASVCLDNECFELQELKITKPLIYNKIQTTYNLFETNEIFTDWKDRLNHKKKVFKDCKSFDDLREIQYGFEKYQIYFNKNNLLNISIELQVSGSPYETIKFLTFDLRKDKDLGIKLFKNKKKLFNKYLKNITDDEGLNLEAEYNYLSQYEIITTQKGDQLSFMFLYVKPDNWKENYHVVLTTNEIKPFLKSKYLKYFKE